MTTIEILQGALLTSGQEEDFVHVLLQSLQSRPVMLLQ